MPVEESKNIILYALIIGECLTHNRILLKGSSMYLQRVFQVWHPAAAFTLVPTHSLEKFFVIN